MKLGGGDCAGDLQSKFQLHAQLDTGSAYTLVKRMSSMRQLAAPAQ